MKSTCYKEALKILSYRKSILLSTQINIISILYSFELAWLDHLSGNCRVIKSSILHNSAEILTDTLTLLIILSIN